MAVYSNLAPPGVSSRVIPDGGHTINDVPPHGRAAAQIRNGELIDYRPADGDPVAQIPIDELWSLRLEKCPPVRKAPSYKGQKNFTGEWWCLTTGSHLPFESWVERDFLIAADFDPHIIGISVQPFIFRSCRPQAGSVSTLPTYSSGPDPATAYL
jgi:hypothetical protein